MLLVKVALVENDGRARNVLGESACGMSLSSDAFYGVGKIRSEYFAETETQILITTGFRKREIYKIRNKVNAHVRAHARTHTQRTRRRLSRPILSLKRRIYSTTNTDYD